MNKQLQDWLKNNSVTKCPTVDKSIPRFKKQRKPNGKRVHFWDNQVVDK